MSLTWLEIFVSRLLTLEERVPDASIAKVSAATLLLIFYHNMVFNMPFGNEI